MKFESYSWWIAVIIGFKSGSCGTIRDYDGFEFGFQLYLEERLGLGRNKVVQIITSIVEKILINSV